ncbi:MAG: pyrroloquinoline quinone-dependent dehydrogenase [Gemmatimonadota bacterium]
MKPIILRVLGAFAVLLFLGCQPHTEAGSGDWPSYGHDPLGARYSPLTAITRANVNALTPAWTFHTGETDSAWATMKPTALEVTPLVIAGTMYLATPLGRVFALDPATGQTRWAYDPKVDRMANIGDFNNRGVSYWVDSAAAAGQPCAARIFLAAIDARLIALDAATGLPCAGFGNGGTVDLKVGLRNQPDYAGEYEQTSPPAIIGGLVIVGGGVADNNRVEAPSGAVRAYDAKTGALRWSWDPVPQDSTDPAWSTWKGPLAHRVGAANAWSVIAADSTRDLVFVPTTSPSVDYYGGHRLGQNVGANSIVALRASTGKLVWQFQTVHHDLWDYDNASPPALTTIDHDGKRVDVVLQATKSSQLYVLDRDTGKPVFPVEERPVPRSDVPGEEAWPTQPFNAITGSLSPTTLDSTQLWAATPGDLAACRQRLASLRNEGEYTPPSLRGTLVYPSNIGGAAWGGLAVDPVRQIAVIPVNTIAAVIALRPRAEWNADMAAAHRGERIGVELAAMTGTPYFLKRETFLSPHGLPCTPPPFGELIAISLKTGKTLWRVPVGDIGDLVRQRDSTVQWPSGLGSPTLGGPIVTAGGLVFIGATLDHNLHAYDIETGKLLWQGPLPAAGKATPMTYAAADGQQMVVIAGGGDGKSWGKSDAVVAFSLPGKP